MSFRKKNFKFFTVLVFCAVLILCSWQPAFGADYSVGKSLVAKDQVKASKGLSIPGLEITWLELGADDYINYYSTGPSQFAEGIFTLPISSRTVSFDTSGKIIASGYNSEVGRFSDGMALIRKQLPLKLENWKPGELVAPPGYQSGYIDNTGKEVIPLGKYNGLDAEFHEGFAVLGAYDEKKGFINKAGDIVIPQIYRNAGDFSEGLAPVQSSETKLWGYIDNGGNTVIPMEYEAAKPFHDGVACVTKKGLVGYIDKTGNPAIEFRFRTKEGESLDRNFYDGLAVAADDSGKYGYIDKTGNFVIPAKYLAAGPFLGDVAIVTSENQAYTNGYGSGFLINRQGERITPLWNYSYFEGETMEDGLIRALSPYGTDPEQSFAVLNSYGAEVIPASLKIKYISPFNEGSALLLAFGDKGTAVGLVKKPANATEIKSGKLIRVFIDGKQLDFTDTDPIIENSRTLVPMRAIFERLGAEVKWDETSKTVSGTKDGTTVTLKIGEGKGHINGKAVDLEAPAKLQNARTLVPVRFIAESFHAEVTWDNAARAVQIKAE
jgi:hypothetical protein